MQTFKRSFSSSTTQIATLVTATITVVNAVLSKYVPAYGTCKAAGNCLATLSELTSAEISSEVVLLTCYTALLVLSFYGVIRAFVQARRDPVGFFYSRVSSLDPRRGIQQVEYNLAEVRRTGNGGLEYRGVGRPSTSNVLEFVWCARDTGVYPTREGYRFIFRTDYRDIPEKPSQMPHDISNIGFVDYEMSRNRATGMEGTFFDFTISGNYVQRKHLNLFNATALLEKKDQKHFDDFFKNRGLSERRKRILEVLSKVEREFA